MVVYSSHSYRVYPCPTVKGQHDTATADTRDVKYDGEFFFQIQPNEDLKISFYSQPEHTDGNSADLAATSSASASSASAGLSSHDSEVFIGSMTILSSVLSSSSFFPSFLSSSLSHLGFNFYALMSARSVNTPSDVCLCVYRTLARSEAKTVSQGEKKWFFSKKKKQQIEKNEKKPQQFFTSFMDKILSVNTHEEVTLSNSSASSTGSGQQTGDNSRNNSTAGGSANSSGQFPSASSARANKTHRKESSDVPCVVANPLYSPQNISPSPNATSPLTQSVSPPPLSSSSNNSLMPPPPPPRHTQGSTAASLTPPMSLHSLAHGGSLVAAYRRVAEPVVQRTTT